jgi:hypothetical protein
MGSANAWRVLLFDTIDKRIGCTHALIPNRMYCIPFNAKPQMELVGSVRLFAKSFHKVSLLYVLLASSSARICRRSVRLESEDVLSASLILHASESVFYYVLNRAIVYKRTYVSRRVRTMLFFAVFLVLEFIDWIICRSQQRLTAGLTNRVRCKSVQGVLQRNRLHFTNQLTMRGGAS